MCSLLDKIGMHSARKPCYLQIKGSFCSLFKYLTMYSACINYYLFYLGSEIDFKAQVIYLVYLSHFSYGTIVISLDLALFLKTLKPYGLAFFVDQCPFFKIRRTGVARD